MSIIVSLTSTSNRLNLCRITLLSLVNQELTPDKIILNLSTEAYLRDKGIQDINTFEYLTESIPKPLHKLIELRWVENTGPYRKLIPTLQQASCEDIIVTADDDIFYDSQWLTLLLHEFDPSKKTIHACRVRKIIKSKFNKPTGYAYWPLITQEEILKDDWIITYGGGAVLYRGWFSEDLIKDSMFLDIAPTADDLWYSKICKLSGLNVKTIPQALNQLVFFIHDDGLVKENFPTLNNLTLKVRYHLVDKPFNYFNLVKFTNDKAYKSIEKYFKI